MLHTLAIHRYRSLYDLVLPLSQLTVISGPNGSGKSGVYRALRLLVEATTGNVTAALAREGGMPHTFWAGPGEVSDRMVRGEVPVNGQPGGPKKRLRFGFVDDDLGYTISLGYPPPSSSLFALDPEIKNETIFAGRWYKPAGALVERSARTVSYRENRKWEVLMEDIPGWESMMAHIADPTQAPAVYLFRERMRDWRFYDHFRTDRDAPARQVAVGTRTPVLDSEGATLAAAIQTILEMGDRELFDDTIRDAFGDASVRVEPIVGGRLSLGFQQHGLLRPLEVGELSDGTLRFLMLTAALLSPRPPRLMVFNEPETSLHPELIPALARLMLQVSRRTQLWVVSHSRLLIESLQSHPSTHLLELEKQLGMTRVKGLGPLEMPAWKWPD